MKALVFLLFTSTAFSQGFSSSGSGAAKEIDTLELSYDTDLAIARGMISGHSLVLKFGRNSDIDAAAEETIWGGGGIYAFPSAAESLKVYSSDADDTTGDTGAWNIKLFGLDSNYVEQSATVTLSGVDTVGIAGRWLRVFRAYVVQAGASHINEGTITILDAVGDTTRLVISALDGQTLHAVYTVPAGKTAYMKRYYVSMNTATPATAASVDVRLFVHPLTSGEINLKHQQSILSGSFQYIFGSPLKIEQKSDIYLNARSSKNDSDVCGGFDLILVDN